MSKVAGFDFNRMPCKYWSAVTKVSFLQRRVLVYSIMYYQFGESCVDDFYYDAISKQLVQMQKGLSKEDLMKTRYGYVFFDYEGSTAFDLYYRLSKSDKEYLEALSQQINKQWKGER